MITTLIVCVSIIVAFYLGYGLGRASYVTEYALRQELQRMIEEKARLTIQPHFRAVFSSQDMKDLREAFDSQLGEVEAPKRKRGRPRKNSIK